MQQHDHFRRQPSNPCDEGVSFESGRPNNAHREEGITPELAKSIASNHLLRCELERLQAEKQHLSNMLRQVADLIGAPSVDKIMHDLRNLLNERELLRVLVGDIAE